jgi:hypothetical protein
MIFQGQEAAGLDPHIQKSGCFQFCHYWDIELYTSYRFDTPEQINADYRMLLASKEIDIDDQCFVFNGESIFAQHGMKTRMLTDNGSPYLPLDYPVKETDFVYGMFEWTYDIHKDPSVHFVVLKPLFNRIIWDPIIRFDYDKNGKVIGSHGSNTAKNGELTSLRAYRRVL